MKVFHAFSLLLNFGTLVNGYQITGPVGGRNTVTGQRPFRNEITNFASSGPQFDLYILALQRFQQDNQQTLLSYYQVSGIHGRPFIPWDGVQGSNDDGYCTHSSILFPPWHRPYLALFEQILWNNAQQIAATYPIDTRGQYQQAAVTLRMPYWDWALNATMPTVVNEPSITINTPTGQRSVNNPLYTYTFHPIPSSSDFPPSDGSIASYPITVRYPDASGRSQPDLVNQQLQGNAQSLHDLTYQVLSDQSNYGPFSNTGFRDDTSNFNSLENIHNAIHGLVGNGGHMSFVPYSAFDPIFWLHHTNVDRLFAIWQAIHPDSYVTSQPSPGTFTNAFGSTEDVSTPLTPFHSDGGSTLYTSTTARETRTFGYSYPEVEDWAASSPEALSAAVRRNVNSLYNPDGSLSKRAIKKRSAREYNFTLPVNVSENLDYPTLTHQYHANIHLRCSSTLSAPFFIHFYLGPPQCNSSETLSFAPNLIGSVTILFTGSTTNDPSTKAQVPLTHSLLANPPAPYSYSYGYGYNSSNSSISTPSIDPLAPVIAIHTLKERLQWRVQLMNDTAVAADCTQLRAAGLEISVVGREMWMPVEEDEFPVYGPFRLYEEATVGKAGGVGGNTSVGAYGGVMAGYVGGRMKGKRMMGGE